MKKVSTTSTHRVLPPVPTTSTHRVLPLVPAEFAVVETLYNAFFAELAKCNESKNKKSNKKTALDEIQKKALRLLIGGFCERVLPEGVRMHARRLGARIAGDGMRYGNSVQRLPINSEHSPVVRVRLEELGAMLEHYNIKGPSKAKTGYMLDAAKVASNLVMAGGNEPFFHVAPVKTGRYRVNVVTMKLTASATTMIHECFEEYENETAEDKKGCAIN